MSRNKQLRIALAAVALGTPPLASTAHAQSACIALLQHGIYNTVSTSESRQTYAQFKQNFCNWYGSYRTSHSGGNANVQIPIVDIPIGLSGGMSYGQAEAQYGALCSTTAGMNSDDAMYINVTKYISTEGAHAFEQCVAAEKTGLRGTANISDDETLVSFDFAYIAPFAARPTATVQSVDVLPQDAFDCPKPQNGGTDIRDIVGQSDKFVNNNFSISCIRKISSQPIDVNGTQLAAPGAMISVHTTVGSYTQQFRPVLINEPLADTRKVLSALPKGTILPWAGQMADIPSGWQVCDGTNGTPNLVHRYALGTKTDAETKTPTGSEILPQLHFSGTTDGPNQDQQSIPNSGNFLKASGNTHTHTFQGRTDPGTAFWPASTYIVYIMKLQNQP